MSAKTGAGASVSSGASYQARVAAYLIVTAVCDVESLLTQGKVIESISFETTESIDDINIALADGSHIYIQAKSTIDYSISSGGELRNVIEQFARQHRSRSSPNDKYYLVTGSRSSRKVTHELRAALEAFRLGSENRFRSDQPNAIVKIIDELLGLIKTSLTDPSIEFDLDGAQTVVRKTFLLALDLENGETLEQAVLLLLQSRNFAAPAAVWGKMVADCVTHSKLRHSVNRTRIVEEYSRFRKESGQLNEAATDDLLRIEFGDMDISVGREVILGRLHSTSEGEFSGLALMEFYRFDDNCNERLDLSNATFTLKANGIEVSLIRRAATHTGMMRMIEADPSLVGDERITLIPINSDRNYEDGMCAQLHRENVRQAMLSNARPLHCIHCGKPVSSSKASVVEANWDGRLIVGLTHSSCLTPNDRVIGVAKSDFFDEHPSLVNFDVNAWFSASHGGQAAFASAELLKSPSPIIVWGGREDMADGPFVVEMLLKGGNREFAHRRNSIHRFSKSVAEAFAHRLNTTIKEKQNTDPLCYTEETKAFGSRSQLIEQLGLKERLLPIEAARARPYDERFAARFTKPGHWYAPLLYLREIDSREPFTILGSIVMLTNPLHLNNHLENWMEAGVPIPNYETVSLLSDRDVDDLLERVFDRGMNVVVDPVLKSGEATGFAAGIPIIRIK